VTGNVTGHLARRGPIGATTPDSAAPAALAAVAAWQALGVAGARPPAGVRFLGSRYKRGTIYGLERAGAGGETVVAKLCPASTAPLERLIHERILPHVDVTAPACYGVVDADEGSLWLFLEDVGSERFSHLEADQRRAAADWLGRLHSHAPDVPAAAELPDRGPRYYLERLRSGRRTIIETIDNPVLGVSDVEVLRSVVALLDTIGSGWAAVEEFCAPLPVTLTHGDFQPKNVYVRRDGSGPRLYPIDWEMAGWGVPAPDVAPARGPVAQPWVDLATYGAVIRRRWAHVDERAIRDLVMVGTLLRRLIAIDWSVRSLRYAWPERPIAQLRIYRREIEEVLAAAPWAGSRRRGGGR